MGLKPGTTIFNKIAKKYRLKTIILHTTGLEPGTIYLKVQSATN